MKKTACTQAEAGVHPAFRLKNRTSALYQASHGLFRSQTMFTVFLRLRAALTVAALAALLAPPLAQASERDQERARQAVQAGQVMPLPAVLDKLATTHPGQVLEVELEREDGAWYYEIRLLQADGQLLKLELDARTAEVLRSRIRR